MAHAPLTVPSHVSILTGQYPSRHGARDNGTFVLDSHAATLASVLRERGYRTGGFVSSFLLAASYGFDRGFVRYDDELPTAGPLLDYELRRPADVVASRASAWLRENAAGPFFAWIHFYDPHAPYSTPPAFRDLQEPYDGAIAAADAGVGAILKTLDDLQVRGRTAVIVTADHGEALGDHGEREHGLLLYDSVLRVPLIIDLPGGSRRVVQRQVRHVDLMPTIVDLAGGTPPADLPGRSLLPVVQAGDAAVAEGDPVAYAESWYGRLHFGWSELRSVRADNWKYIEGPHPQLYDVRRDPGERVNLVAKRSDLAARLRRELLVLGRGGTPLGQARAPDADTIERLHSLGYLGGGPSTTRALASSGADPADMLPLFEKYTRTLSAGLAALRAGRTDAALARFHELTAEYPDGYEAHHYLGYAYAAAGRNGDAVREYTRTLAIAPDYAIAHFNLAKALSALGQPREAAIELQRGFAIEPRSFYGSMIDGVVAWSANDDRRAMAAFLRAAQLNPVEPRARANLAEACMRAGDYRGAREAFDTLVRMGYQRAAAHFNLGVIAERLGDAAGARREYREALALDPALEGARRALDSLR
jgi:arylsulfatase A-like enzyme/Flp pilus assembly protein TadD